ncbi:uncharacterized protein LOC131425318 isoform X3 [Malaya genurostris]|uniref:uncharacterized protein LOC131425318 isoform X3 n=1 Tax=Malaya genurostris TaxID=325434 RepID=UPI0026F3FEF8|nr:uncharacterized protein LOC131425318 isoform X3 [Malaya genurostris]
MKQTVVLFIIGCTVLGTAFTGAQNSASGDPAPGRSPGPPGVQQVTDSEHGEPVEDAPPTFILTRDIADNWPPLTSNDVLDASDFEDKEVDGPEQFTGDVSSESSSVLTASTKSSIHAVGELDSEDLLQRPDDIAANNPCSDSVDDYLKVEDEIVPVEAEGSGGSQSLQIDVTHDVFDTANGIVPGVIYQVEVRRPEQSEIRDFYIESLEGVPPLVEHGFRRSRSKAVGHFLDSNQQSNSINHPEGLRVNMQENTWIDDLEADWVSGHRQASHANSGARKLIADQHTRHQDAVRWNGIQPNVEAYFEDGDGDDSEELDSAILRNDCPRNAWKQDFMFSNRMAMNWSVIRERPKVNKYGGSSSSLGDSDLRNRTVYFRILYRTMTSHIVYELNYPMVLLKECYLLLKETSGFLDSSKLPAEHDNCRIGFPMRLKDSELAIDGVRHSPPGLVIQLTRLNIPCRTDGGYLKFTESVSSDGVDGHTSGVVNGANTQGHFLCGKLEELPRSDRTFHFQKHRSTSLSVHNRPVFSFNYRLVDYCYNVTISDRNSSVLLRPLRSLDCRFRIHLPFGYRVSLRLTSNGVNWVTNSSTIKHEQIDLGVVQDNSYDTQCYNGIRVEVYEQMQNRWVRCIDGYSDATVYTLLTSDNSVVIHVSKYSLLAALEAAADNGSSSRTVPSLLIEHDAQPIESVISQCAFGWIASSQFCIAAFESESLSWHEAEQECNRLGGHLASIRSVAEQKLIDQLLLKSPNYEDRNAYWIGASDRTLEGDFRWSDNLPFTYSNWFPGWVQQGNYNRQPNDDGFSEQDCVEIRRQFQTPPSTPASGSSLAVSYMWNDRDCETQNLFLCERVVVEEALEKTWHEDCNKTILLSLDQPKATIWSPRFPRTYPDNVNCLTIITAPPGYRIVLDFEELVLESEPLCAYDYLQILEPSTNYSAAYTKPSRSFGSVPLFQTRNPRHSTSRFYVRRRKSSPIAPKNELGDRLMATFASKAPNLVLQPEDTSYNLRIPPPDLKAGRVPRKVCGDWSSKMKLLRHVSKGPHLGLRFVSDYSNHFGGYKAKVAMENVISECYDERFKAYNASCYLFISYPEVDWMTAQQVCRGIGAQLASISTTDEQRFITASIRNSLDYTPRAMYWVGGELADTGLLEWADGAKLQFEGWLPGQRPDPKQLPKASSICLGLQWKISPTPMISSGLHWSAQKCTTVGGYVCKKPRPTAEINIAKNQTLTGTEGRLLSPNYPNPYPSRTDYWVRLVAPENSRIIIQFQKLDIEQQEECLYDYISIQNFEVLPSPELNPGTNPFPMAMFYERTEDLPSVDYTNDQPFQNLLKGEYYQEQNSSPRREQRFHKKRSLPSNDDIQQKLQDNIKLLEKVNSKLKDRKKRFLSSDNYKTVKNSNQSIALETNGMELPDSNTWPSFLPYVRWCGTHDSNMTRFNFISDGNEAFLRFHSDYSVSASGYSATWSSVDISGCPIQTITSREGSIHSPNYPHFLLNKLDCTYIIQAPFGKKVWLEFVFFDILQDAFVHVDISDGPFEPFRDESHLNDGVFLSKGERMVVRLKSGSLPRGKGFHATFKTLSTTVEQRTINLENKTAGNLFHLNYPQTAPFEVDFTQHLIAPLGTVILLELHGVGFSEHGCYKTGFIEVYDNYADKNGTLWHLCEIIHSNASGSNSYSAEYRAIESSVAKPAPIYITSYLNTLHVRQRNVQGLGVRLNATVRLQSDIGYKMKLITNDEEWVESCKPNPCQSGGKCVLQKDRGICHCRGYFTGRFCALNMCELEPCYFGKCELTQSSFKCLCQPGYMGQRCDEKPKPCEDNPCEGRGECHPKNGGFFCRCHAWWEGPRCEKRMMRIPYKPLSERMLQEPFWLGLITVFVVLAVIGLVWCAKRHFPEKIEKLLADEAHRNRTNFPPHHLNTALREQLQATAGTVPSSTATTPATHRTIFGRLGIRKPSLLSLSSPQQVGGATARTFSLDDLLRPPPRRTPSPRKKRNNSTPTKKNVNEKKQILQQLVSPAPNSATKQVSLGELIQLSENRLKVNHTESESDIKETTFSEHSLSVSSIVRQISDPKLEKKVTFARLLSKVSAEISSGSDDLANGTKHCSALSLPTEVTHRANSVPQSPCTNEIRSPHSTSSNQGSDSLSSSELALHDFGLRGHRRARAKVSSADSILAMFKNFATSSAGINLPSSIVISPSSTPTASSPQDDVAGDDDSSTSSVHTPVSFSSGAPDSPIFYRQSTIEVPVLDALSAHKTSTPSTAATQLHPPTILLEIPSNGINNKCLSPIREMPTPIPSPALTPIMPRPHRIRSPQNMYDESMSVTFSGNYSGYNNSKPDQVTIEINHPDSDTDSPTPMNMSSQSDSASSNSSSKSRKNSPNISISIDVQPPTPKREKPERPRDLVIPELIIQQPSPTKERSSVVIFPGSPPPQRASIGETSFYFPNKQQQKRLLKQWEKPGSLDLPFEPPMITVTSNMNEVESDADCMSPAATGKPHLANRLGVTGSSVGMCYLSPFSMCTRGERAPSESNLSSSGYSSMASPGPSRCGSSNPLCPSEMEDPGAGPAGTSYHGLNSMLGSNRGRQTSILKKHNESGGSGTATGGTTDRHESFRQRSDSETLSDDPLLESNDEGIGTDHLDEKIEDGEIRSAKELENYIGKELIENGRSILNQEVVSMSQLQLPSIVIQSESGFDKLSPVSSRSESPLSDRTASMERFSPLFYGKKDQQLPFTDSDGLYDFPSSDGKGSSTTNHRKSTGRRRERRSSRSGNSLSPSKSTSVLLEIPGKERVLNQVNSPNSHTGPKQSSATPTRKSPKRRPLYRHPVASSSSSTESLTSTREYAQRSSKAVATYTKETTLFDSGDDTGESQDKSLPSTSPSLSTTTTTSATKNSKQPEEPPRFACADSDIFQRLLSYKLNRLTSLNNSSAVATKRSASKQSSSFGSYSYTRIAQFDNDIDREDDVDDEADQIFFRKDVSSQILPTVPVEEMNRPKSKIGRLKAIGNQIRFLRRLERSIQRKDRPMGISDEDGSSSRDSPRVTSPLLRNQDSSPVASGSRLKPDQIVVVEAPNERTPLQQLLIPSSAVGAKSRQNFKMSRQKRVANSRGGGFSEQPWLERERRLLGSGDVNSE